MSRPTSPAIPGTPSSSTRSIRRWPRLRSRGSRGSGASESTRPSSRPWRASATPRAGATTSCRRSSRRCGPTRRSARWRARSETCGASTRNRRSSEGHRGDRGSRLARLQGAELRAARPGGGRPGPGRRMRHRRGCAGHRRSGRWRVGDGRRRQRRQDPRGARPDAGLAATRGLPGGRRLCAHRLADPYALPFDDEAFDACRADRVFHHLVDPAKALAEMARVTRPGGRVVVSDTDYDTLVVEAADVEVTRRILAHHTERMESGRVGRRLRGLFLDAGLASIEILPYAAVATEYDEEVLKLRDKAERAAASGAIESETAQRWVASLVDADRAGRFVCAQIVLSVSGRRA